VDFEKVFAKSMCLCTSNNFANILQIRTRTVCLGLMPNKTKNNGLKTFLLKAEQE